jgi:5-carboxymethyl-2-hydroxymuconate isomerase
MPHVIIEHSAGLAAKVKPELLLARIHAAVLQTRIFEPDSIKSRTSSYHHYQLGNREAQDNFVHVTISILSGRSETLKQTLGKAVLVALQETVPDASQLTVEIREMNRSCYFKISR